MLSGKHKYVGTRGSRDWWGLWQNRGGDRAFRLFYKHCHLFVEHLLSAGSFAGLPGAPPTTAFVGMLWVGSRGPSWWLGWEFWRGQC